MIKTIFSRPGEHYYGPEYKLFLISFPTAVRGQPVFFSVTQNCFRNFSSEQRRSTSRAIHIFSGRITAQEAKDVDGLIKSKYKILRLFSSLIPL